MSSSGRRRPQGAVSGLVVTCLNADTGLVDLVKSSAPASSPGLTPLADVRVLGTSDGPCRGGSQTGATEMASYASEGTNAPVLERKHLSRWRARLEAAQADLDAAAAAGAGSRGNPRAAAAFAAERDALAARWDNLAQVFDAAATDRDTAAGSRESHAETRDRWLRGGPESRTGSTPREIGTRQPVTAATPAMTGSAAAKPGTAPPRTGPKRRKTGTPPPLRPPKPQRQRRKP